MMQFGSSSESESEEFEVESNCSEDSIISKDSNRDPNEPDEFVPDSGWTTTEKRQLFNALADYGSTNLKLLASHIPTRNVEEIKSFVKMYQTLARRRIKDNSKVSTQAKAARARRQAPLDAWLNYTMRSMKDNTYKSMLFSRALKYIALFEHRIGLTNVHIKSLYEVLSTCLEGEAPRYLNRESSAFLVENLQKLAKDIRFRTHTDEEMFLKGPKKWAGIKCYGGKKKTEMKDSLNMIVNDAAINPLRVPEKLLYM